MSIREWLKELTVREIVVGAAQSIVAVFCIWAILVMLLALGA